MIIYTTCRAYRYLMLGNYNLKPNGSIVAKWVEIFKNKITIET